MEAWWLAAGGALLLVALVAVVLRRRRRGAVAAGGAALVPTPPRDRLREGLLATRGRLLGHLEAAFGRSERPDAASSLEEALLAADVGAPMAAELVRGVQRRVGQGGAGPQLRDALRQEIESALEAGPSMEPTSSPWVVLVTGVNGVGKTTTIGKLAARHVAAGRRVMLVAADTFRAAAIEQLAVWAERAGADFVRQAAGANPAAVAYDGVKAALARRSDVVLVDTAGRLHTRANLMEELRKIQRVIAREVPGAPHETLLVLDATTGQNAIAQARVFAEAVGLTGIVLTKLDGTARGGVAIAVRRELGVPIRYVGVGEAIEDLRPFDAQEFVAALFADDEISRSSRLTPASQ